jgi:Leucine-rich repeat (LRR) protein
MKVSKIGKDQLENNFFVSKNPQWTEGHFQEFDEKAKDFDSISISTLAMDFPEGTSIKEKKLIEQEWIKQLPTLDNVKSLSVRHRVDQPFFEAICKMPNIESLTFWTSKVTDLNSLKTLEKLEFLHLASFSQLKDISPLINLKSLMRLSIDNCFKVENYNLIGKMDWIEALALEGDTFAPKNLIIPSLKPFTSLKNLKHLEVSTTSIKDKSFEEILKFEKLIRLDAHWRMKKEMREKILQSHPNLKSVFFVAYDFVKNEFKENIEWWV